MENTFDYVVVGAGSSGCVMANRLSEDGTDTVLILEAGGKDTNMFIHMPSGYSQLVPNKNDNNYGFETEPESTTNNRPLYWPRGKGWGGSSSINAMIYIRGHSYDYDLWRQQGNEGWSYDDVLPYFKKAENFHGDGDEEFHGYEGPLHVKKSDREDDLLLEKFIEAGQQAGFPYTRDFNGKEQEGVSRYEHTINDTSRGPRRWSSAQAYLHPALERENLSNEINVTVDKLIMDGKKVTGIEYINEKGERKSCFANKEVILSAGALGSPLILMRSGIGDPNDITKHGIDLVHELKGVGKNMQDHYGVTSSFYATKPVTLHRSVSWIKTQIAGIKYLLFGTGDASYPPCSGGGFIKSSPEKDLPDTQLHYVSIQGEDQHFRTGVTKEHGFSCIAYICRPQSRGYLTLKSADPEDEPLLYPNYLSEEEDVIDLRNALRETRRILMQPAFDEFRGDPVKPGPEINIDDDEELDNWIRENGETLYHPVSTCKMGNDEMSVVDDDLKVHGIHGLRVVDASIMPTLIAGNTNAPAIMIAEKAADLIRQAS